MRRILNDAIEHFLDWMREQDPSCEEKAELRERVREELPLRPGRNRRFTYEEVQSICKRIVALTNDGKSIAEAEEDVARERGVKTRAIRSVWQSRFERGWRP
jgi:hypothetical protein